MKENDKGCRFPVWGLYRFSTKLILADGNDDVDNFYKNLILIIFYFLSNSQKKENTLVSFVVLEKKLQELKILNTMNNHKLGITPEKMKKNKKSTLFIKMLAQ